MVTRQISSLSNSPVKVLVVDDHPNTANMLARAISRLGSHVDVVSATSGVEALHCLEESTADILITDMMMPEMTGVELIEKLNDDPSISPTITFLLTAHDSPGVREVAQRLNVKEVISKPAHPEQICELIAQTISELKSSKSVNTETTHEEVNLALNADASQAVMNVSQLLWEVAKKFQPQADVKDHLLVVGKTAPDSMVRGNPAKLRHALRTLVWSAIKNTPRGGTVILSSEKEENTVKIQVRDTGYGVPSCETPEENPFLENGLEDPVGVSQDLAVARTIVEQHGGHVSVQSEPGKGSCFIVSLTITA